MLGLIGGMSWVSTGRYYRRLNRAHEDAFSGAGWDGLVRSLDFAAVRDAAREPAALGAILVAEYERLVDAGATSVAITSVTGDTFWPTAHAADAAAVRRPAETLRTLVRAAPARVGLLSTGIARSRFADYAASEGIPADRVVMVDERQQRALDDAIERSLFLGSAEPSARAAVSDCIAALHRTGAATVILGCTELGLVFDDTGVPEGVVDIVDAHVDALVGGRAFPPKSRVG